MKIELKHSQTAHCENGAAINLLRYNGLDISEPMAFGIGSGLYKPGRSAAEIAARAADLVMAWDAAKTSG